MKVTFRPEFLNRIDEIIVFNRLGKEDILRIVDIQLGYLMQRLKEKKIDIQITPKAKVYLCEQGFDPQFGARPLKRTIQKLVQNPMAKMILAGKTGERHTVAIDVGKDGLKINSIDSISSKTPQTLVDKEQ